MRGHLLLARFASTVWAMEPSRYAACVAVLKRWASGAQASEEVMVQVHADAEAREARRGDTKRASNGAVAVLPMYGVITQRGNAMDDLSGPGSTSTQMFTGSLREAVADETVGAIVIDIDSPGGSVFGIEELGDEIFSARSKKPIIAYANSLAASAAYWLGSQATELHVTPSGEVGSIGVICSHADWSKWNEDNGVKFTYVTAGKYKAEGNPDEPLSTDAKDFLQSRIDDYYSAFTKAVARGRGVPVASVRADMGEGRCFGADQALAAKMVDAVSTFDQVVKRARALATPAAAPKGASKVARMRNELSLQEQSS